MADDSLVDEVLEVVVEIFLAPEEEHGLNGCMGVGHVVGLCVLGCACTDILIDAPPSPPPPKNRSTHKNQSHLKDHKDGRHEEGLEEVVEQRGGPAFEDPVAHELRDPAQDLHLRVWRVYVCMYVYMHVLC